MNAPCFKVEMPEWDDARIEAIAELLVRLIDDDGRIALLDGEQEPEATNTAGEVPAATL